MNFMSDPFPYTLRAGFWVFLQSERERHKQDIAKIDKMIVEIEEMTPALRYGKVRESLVEFSKRFVEFNL